MEREQLVAQIGCILHTTPLNNVGRPTKTIGAANTAPAVNVKGGATVPLLKFGGYQDIQAPQDLLDKFSEYCNISGVPPGHCLQLLPAALERSTKQWRHFGLSFKKMCNESATVDESTVEFYHCCQQQSLLQQFAPKDIANAPKASCFTSCHRKNPCFRGGPCQQCWQAQKGTA